MQRFFGLIVHCLGMLGQIDSPQPSTKDSEVISGLGIADFVCHFRNPDQRQVRPISRCV